MAQRLIELVVPAHFEDDVEQLLEKDDKVFDFWCARASGEKVQFKILVDAEESQTVIDQLENNYDTTEGFRLLMFHVEASLPIQKEEEKEEEKEKKEDDDGEETRGVSRVELYTAASDQIKLSSVYLLLMGLSAIVAAIGVLRSDVAVIIGAMVIAPLLGPNVGLSLATTLADSQLAKKAIRTNLAGVLLSFVIAVIIGILFTENPTGSVELMARTNVGYGDVALALAAGSAGALAYTRSIPAALIGVMVAIALVPTIVTSGLLLGAGYFTLSFYALMLFLINLICINLSGVFTFLMQGFTPSQWWKADKAKKLTRLAIAIWVALLLFLVGVISYLRFL
ncbi:MAG: TIGR00341 family protein [Thermoplasmata archaeon]